MSNEWNWDDDYAYGFDKPVDNEVCFDYCNHEFRPILLIYSTVYNCKKCGKKKEECQNE